MKPETHTQPAHSQHTEAHLQLYALTVRAVQELDKVIRKHTDSIIQWLQVQYGEDPPSYEQFWNDRDALTQIAHERGLKSDQSIRKPYNAAVKQLYGEKIMEATDGRSALPVSESKEAVAKRMTRPMKLGIERKEAPGKTPTPKTAEQAIRALLEKYGLAAVLHAFSVVLAEHRETSAEAKRLAALIEKAPGQRRTHNILVPAGQERRAAH